MLTSVDIGTKCKLFRKYTLKITQQVIADELGYSVSNISAFEKGSNTNYNILAWYVKNGFNFNGVVKKLWQENV